VRVLLADDNQERGDAVSVRLREAGVTEIARLAPGESLAEAVQARSPDVVIMDMSRPDRDSLESIRKLSRGAPRPIVLFVDRDDPQFMEEAIEAGVSSYNLVGSSLPDVKPIVQAAVAIFRRYRKLADNLAAAESKLNERAIIQRAKARLMQEQGLTEPHAHRWLRRTAMNRGKRMVDVASELLAKAEGTVNPSDSHA
jgi:two-component system, response regulator / RNA-binding antiterminator